MKLNSDASKLNVCKEEVLMCLFKDVPNFLVDDEKDGVDVEESWVRDSHQELIIGKQGLPKHVPVTSSIEQADLTKIWEQKGSLNTTSVSKFNKCKRSSPVSEESTELELWSSPFVSEENIPKQPKKQQKTAKQSKSNKHSQPLNAIMLTTPLNITKSVKKDLECKLKTDELCDACQIKENNCEESWLSFSEDENESDDELMRKWDQASKNQLGRKGRQSRLSCNDSLKNIPIKNYTEKQVLKLLSNVEANLLECSILLTTQNLQNKVCKAKATSDDSMDKETPSGDALDQIQQSYDQIVEERSKYGSSKLWLALSRFVHKYFKVAQKM